MRRDDERHGTWAGAQVHRKEGKRPCKACREASAAYMRDYRGRTTGWRDQQSARVRAVWALARLYPDDYRRLYFAELEEAPLTDRERRALRRGLREAS